MRITSVRFRRLQSHDRGYGHDAVEFEAAVEEHDDPEDVMAALKERVGTELANIKTMRDLSDTVERLRSQESGLRFTNERLEKEIETNRGIIKAHDKLADLAREQGLNDEADALDPQDDIPF